MTPEEIVESILTLAEEASHKKLTFGVIVNMATGETRDVQAEMVSWVRAAIAEEREACAKLIEGSEGFDTGDFAVQLAIRTGVSRVLAAAIRARSSEPKATAP